jgi:hypothetical protein
MDSLSDTDGLMRALFACSSVLAVLAVLPAQALAHGGHANHGARGISAVPITVFAAGMLVLVTGLYLDSWEDVADGYANAGIAIGILGLLAAIGLFLF